MNATEKSTLRKAVRTCIQGLSPGAREEESKKIIETLMVCPYFQAAQSILFFSPLPDEPDLLPLIVHALKQKKTAVLPRFIPGAGFYEVAQIRDLAEDLLIGQFKILEPATHCPVFPLNQLDLSLVPGVAFDLSGRRLGRGKGYYDRLLAKIPGRKCGVSFDCQVQPIIPMEDHDIMLDCLVTASVWKEVARTS